MSISQSWHQEALLTIENKLNYYLKCRTSQPKSLVDSICYSSLDGGKRIRPLLSLASGELSLANPTNSLILGVSCELIHCFSLIHDDLPIMDNDDLRRGRPTNHKVFGEAIALLAGDAIQALSFEILSQPEFDIADSLKIKIINLLANAIGINGMVGGQTIDWESTGKKLSLNELKAMHGLKTGALLKTAILGGYLVGNNYQEEVYKLLIQIADKLGLLFQIVDDIIDVTEDTITLGKTANKDSLNDKATFVTLFGLNEAKLISKTLNQEIQKLIKACPYSQNLSYIANLIYTRHA